MVRIIADSTCDLSQELIEKYRVAILPLHILLGEDEFEDGRDIKPEEIYRWSDAHATTPGTSAPSMESALNLYREVYTEGDELICFSISGQMSTSGNVMRLAAEEMGIADQVTVIDSENLSTGIGHLVVEAAIMAKEGKRVGEIVDRIETLRPLVRASFVVDTLVYLHRGGRCSGLAAMLGGTLHLHPMIVVENGKMHSSKKYRGSLSKALMAYARDLEPAMRKAKRDRVFITHSGCEPETVKMVQEFLEGLGIFREILETRAGGVISSHCGPGTLGILFIEDAE
ncbi:MAG: DegV family protein [Lachnospiraceae bacterium]|nr:DegV family protein [Lachnospiraceae bacterium]